MLRVHVAVRAHAIDDEAVVGDRRLESLHAVPCHCVNKRAGSVGRRHVHVMLSCHGEWDEGDVQKRKKKDSLVKYPHTLFAAAHVSAWKSLTYF